MAGQHYLPQAYLRAFASRIEGKGKKRQYYICTFDKYRRRVAEENIRNVCQEEKFYDYRSQDGVEVKFDKELEPLERRGLDILNAFRKYPSLQTLKDQRQDIAFLVAFLITRSKAFRRDHTQLMDALRQVEPDSVTSVPVGDELKYDHIRYMHSTTRELAARLLQMNWSLIHNASKARFYTADYPFALNRGTVQGKIYLTTDNVIHLPSPTEMLEVPGIELFFPLTPTLGIAFFDPTIGGDAFNFVAVPEQYVEAVNTSLVVWCVRTIFSSDGSFSLAQKIIQEYPQHGDPAVSHNRILEANSPEGD